MSIGSNKGNLASGAALNKNGEFVSDKAKQFAIALDNALAKQKGDLIFTDYKWKHTDHSEILHMSNKDADVKVYISYGGAYFVIATVDGKRVPVKGDGSKHDKRFGRDQANVRWFADTVLIDTSKAVSTRINNRAKNKARREAYDDKKMERMLNRAVTEI